MDMDMLARRDRLRRVADDLPELAHGLARRHCLDCHLVPAADGLDRLDAAEPDRFARGEVADGDHDGIGCIETKGCGTIQYFNHRNL
jgi:hypothetical protein